MVEVAHLRVDRAVTEAMSDLRSVHLFRSLIQDLEQGAFEVHDFRCDAVPTMGTLPGKPAGRVAVTNEFGDVITYRRATPDDLPEKVTYGEAEPCSATAFTLHLTLEPGKGAARSPRNEDALRVLHDALAQYDARRLSNLTVVKDAPRRSTSFEVFRAGLMAKGSQDPGKWARAVRITYVLNEV